MVESQLWFSWSVVKGRTGGWLCLWSFLQRWPHYVSHGWQNHASDDYMLLIRKQRKGKVAFPFPDSPGSPQKRKWDFCAAWVIRLLGLPQNRCYFYDSSEFKRQVPGRGCFWLPYDFCPVLLSWWQKSGELSSAKGPNRQEPWPRSQR